MHAPRHTGVYPHTLYIRGNCSAAVLSERKMEGDTDSTGEVKGSCAFTKTAALEMKGLISLAVRLRTTGCRLAPGEMG